MAIKTADCKLAIVSQVLAPDGATMLARAYSGTSNINEFLKNVHVIDMKTLSSIRNPTIQDVLAFAGDPNQWKRREKNLVHRVGQCSSDFGAKTKGTINFRGFDCTPFDDQLRAYTWDDGNQILEVCIQGE